MFTLGGIGKAIEGDKSVHKPNVAIQSQVTKPQSESTSTNNDTSENDAQKEKVKATPTDKTTGEIQYGIAVQACDKVAQRDLFPGAKYKPNHILGQIKGQIGLSPDQYLAIYSVKVDGRKTAITCLVDGTKDNPNVISVREFEAK